MAGLQYRDILKIKDKVHDKSCCNSLLKYSGVKKYMCRDILVYYPKVCRVEGWSGCVNLKVN